MCEERFLHNEILNNKSLDALLITNPVNIRYLSGFKGEGALYLSRDLRVIITDSRYTEAASKESRFDIIEENAAHKRTQIISELLEKDKAGLLGYEDKYMTCHTFASYREKIKDVRKWTGISDEVASIRQVKTPQEIAYIEKACAIADKVFKEICGQIEPGMTEMEGAAELEYRMKRLGADGLSFPAIFAAGKNSSMPHAVPSDYRVQPGDFITMDFGCTFNGYCSDMTRTVAVGHVSEKQKKIYETVLKAQQTGVKAAAPDLKGKEIDAEARNVIKDAGYGQYFGHSLGHGIGLECHENPRFSPLEENLIKEGMVITVEPGIYLPGEFGVRIEDTVVITKDGCRPLTLSPKELIVL